MQDHGIIGEDCRRQRSGLEVCTLTCLPFLYTKRPLIYPFSPAGNRRILPTAAIAIAFKAAYAKNTRSGVSRKL
jgi:hypothetical protein